MSKQADLLSEIADIPGSGTTYRLSIGRREETDAAEREYDTPPTWKQLADDAFSFCRIEGICISYLAEQGGIRRGKNDRYAFPDEVKLYIVSQIFKKK